MIFLKSKYDILKSKFLIYVHFHSFIMVSCSFSNQGYENKIFLLHECFYMYSRQVTAEKHSYTQTADYWLYWFDISGREKNGFDQNNYTRSVFQN